MSPSERESLKQGLEEGGDLPTRQAHGVCVCVCRPQTLQKSGECMSTLEVSRIPYLIRFRAPVPCVLLYRKIITPGNIQELKNVIPPLLSVQLFSRRRSQESQSGSPLPVPGSEDETRTQAEAGRENGPRSVREREEMIFVAGRENPDMRGEG